MRWAQASRSSPSTTSPITRPIAPMTKLSGFEPNVEAIAGYDPDLVVASFDPGGLVKGMKKLEIPILLQDAAKNLDGAYAQIETLGEATGHEAKAEDRGRRHEEGDRRAGGERLGGRAGQRVSRARARLYSATSNTFIGSIYKLLGGRRTSQTQAGKKARRLPAALGRVHRLVKPRGSSSLSDTKCCAQTPENVAQLARDGSKIAAVAKGNVIPVERRHRLALGAANRGVHPRPSPRAIRKGGGRRGGIDAPLRAPPRRSSAPALGLTLGVEALARLRRRSS